MTDQLAITVPETTATRPVVIPPGAVRCWISARPGTEDDPYRTHFKTEARAASSTPGWKARQLPYVCAIAACIGCQVRLHTEYGGILHCPNWAEAERVARCDGWTIGTRGEFTCPACQEGR